MAVPDTNTFSLQDVVDEISPASDDLSTCIAEANAAYWDTTYATLPATKLSEFRNYGPSLDCNTKWRGNSSRNLVDQDFYVGQEDVTKLLINRIEISPVIINGVADQGTLSYNGVELQLNTDMEFEIDFSEVSNLYLVSLQGGIDSCSLGSSVFIYFKLKANGFRYRDDSCSTGEFRCRS